MCGVCAVLALSISFVVKSNKRWKFEHDDSIFEYIRKTITEFGLKNLNTLSSSSLSHQG